MHKAREHKFFDLHTFNVEEYEHYEQVEVCNDYLNYFLFGLSRLCYGPRVSNV